ncbi:hypothetical protein [Acetobacterium sp. UBA5834]|jgi:hypothetical protein|uniref:hypothetical protein n=1 Tax=Acetobacterium sp. UBA5834 TaxID=1945907 RepID=UPI00257EF461|nr:hypothetical protein [Acetobacterium sp. UBA5834]
MNTPHDHHQHCNHDHHHGSHDHQGIKTHLHEDALVCSGEREISGELETVKKQLVSEIELLAAWIEKNGGIIGHIKALVEAASPVTVISTTGEEVAAREIAGSVIHVSVVAIVFNINPSNLECRMATLLGDLQK